MRRTAENEVLIMEERLKIAILSPAGNVTAIVLSAVAPERRSALAEQLLALPELHIEQAAFLVPPQQGGEIRLEMMGGEFCGNALRCAGFYQALRRSERGKCCVMAEISGVDGVLPVMVDVAQSAASTTMPLPVSVAVLDWPEAPVHRVTFDGITHYVIDRAEPDNALIQRAIQDASASPAVGVMFFNRATGAIRPVVYVRQTDSCVAETSCASGSTATAIVLSSDLRDGITEIGVGQPGGDLEVGVRKEAGQVTGLSIGGPVALVEIIELRIEAEALTAEG